MSDLSLEARLSRRRILALGGPLAGSLITASTPIASQSITAQAADAGDLPVEEIERILQADGTVTNGVLTIEPGRTDLHVSGRVESRSIRHGLSTMSSTSSLWEVAEPHSTAS